MNTKDFLVNNHVIKTGQKALDCFCNICPNMSVYKNKKPSETVKKLWQKYIKTEDCTNSLNGKILELIIAIILYNSEIMPFYTNAKVHFVPGVNYDILLFSKDNFPIVLSIKTSLRERWKQADLEALALNNVYRKAQTYLLTLEEHEAAVRLDNKDEWLGLEDVIYCCSDKFDKLIDKLKEYKYITPEKIELIDAQAVIKP